MHMQNVEVYVSGSNSKFLSKDVVTEFRGRGDEIRVWPLSFAEYAEENDIMPYHDENGFLILGLKDFLLNPDSLDQ